MIKLIASDLDGTITTNRNSIPPENMIAMDTIKKKKVDFAICTGKTYSISKTVCQKCNASYGIFGNGMQIVNLKTGEEIYHSLLSKEQLMSCLEKAKKYHLHVHVYTQNSIITPELKYMDLRNYVLSSSYPDLTFEIKKDIFSYLQKQDITIYKLVISSIHDLSFLKRELLDSYPLSISHVRKRGPNRDSIIDKEYEYLDITPIGISKHSALQILSSHLHIEKQDIMAIGDNLNDIDMVKNSGIGVAVANAYSDLKRIATFTTSLPAENGGFAEAIDKYLI